MKSTFRFSILLCLLALLTSCAGNKEIEGIFSPDPTLKESPDVIASDTKENPDTPQEKLPENFPSGIPLYPEAKLVTTKSLEDGAKTQTDWTSSAPINIIANYYQQQFEKNNWEIIESASSQQDRDKTSLLARKEQLQVKVSLTKAKSGTNTEFSLEYQEIAAIKPDDLEIEKPEKKSPNTKASTDLADLEQEPAPTREYIKDLVALDVLSIPQSGEDEPAKFDASKPITRREFARWLLATHNRLWENTPSRQIRPASQTTQPAFQDLTNKDADFATIQGLAEAGLIPSRLTGDSTSVIFRPDAPLTREDLLLWKVPLDTRKALPIATVEAVKQTWGFQDTAEISPKALRAVLVDHSNGEKSNIQRMFGYTTLLQPKKPVTRGEAASALWYFGYQGDGISAKEVKQAQPQTQEKSQ